jgi:hypothetical protein
MSRVQPNPPSGVCCVVARSAPGLVSKNLGLAEARDKILRELEKRYVERLLGIHEGDVGKAAAASGIGERYLRVIRARLRNNPQNDRVCAQRMKSAA